MIPLKLWAALAVGGLVLAGFAAALVHTHRSATNACEMRYSKALEAARNESRTLADALEQARQKSRQATETKTRTIYLEPDPTGCADTPAVGSVLEALRPSAD